MTASPTNNVSRPPELLAPAGDWDCLRAAIENGADAVYFGLDCGFNARARAHNFSPDELPEVMRTLHRRGVKGYVTLNTLAFSDELPAVQELIRRLAAAGVDALLVQDLGVARLARAICPELALHASTQMTLTSAECIEIAAGLGIERVVLARELSVDEIDQIHRRTSMPLEAFVHGALCVAYSGQCLTSESLGGRSANRGQCAQACRLPYELVCDGKDIDLGDQKYLLSPQDLAAYELTRDLIAAGVCSFKIEGRLKTPEYVANIVRHYRAAIDRVTAGGEHGVGTDDLREMELSFSRGFSPGWLKGCDHKMLVPALSSSKRGVFLGTITAIRHERIRIELAAPIRRGDGVVFSGNRSAGEEIGGRVFEVWRYGNSLVEPVSVGQVELSFAYGSVAGEKLHVGQQVWKTDDPELTARLKKTYVSGEPLRKSPLDVEVTAAVGGVLQIVARADNGAAAKVVWPGPLAEAQKHPLDEAVLKQQLGRLGGSIYTLRNVAVEITGRPMVPLSVLGKLRHELLEKLAAAEGLPAKRTIAQGDALAQLRATLPAQRVSQAMRSEPPRLHVLCRSLKQLETVLDCGVKRVYAEFQDIREYGAAVNTARQAGAELWLATPRIQKPGETGIFRTLAKHQPAGVLVRNLAGLGWFAQEGLATIADFSLNAANELTAQYLRERGARRVTASYDLNREQLEALVQATPAEWIEVVIHQHMPMFHMEHCVFCAVLSPGTNKTNCGRPCDVHQVSLRDRVGMEHPLHADVGCRNTLYNAVPQSAAEAVPDLLARGLRDFRVELLNDAPAREIAELVDLYARLLRDELAGRDVWSRLRTANRVGVTRGTLEERRNPLAIL